MGSDYYPAGVTYLPGESPADVAWERLMESVPDECPGCGFNTFPEGDDTGNAHGLASHVHLSDNHDVVITCQRENVTATAKAGDPPTDCDTELARGRCGCPDCDPRCP